MERNVADRQIYCRACSYVAVYFLYSLQSFILSILSQLRLSIFDYDGAVILFCSASASPFLIKHGQVKSSSNNPGKQKQYKYAPRKVRCAPSWQSSRCGLACVDYF